MHSRGLWRTTHETLASLTCDGDLYVLAHVRDFRYPLKQEEVPEVHFVSRAFRASDVRSAWIAIIPFRPHFAHIITSFGLSDGSYIAISVEIRYRIGEPYILSKTFVPHYWLSYVVATEDDVFRIRTDVRRREPLHLYKLALTEAEASRMCVAMLMRAQRVNHDAPERFNSVWNSCASNVLTHLREDAGKRLSWSHAHYCTDRLDLYLAREGLLDIVQSDISALRAQHCINALAREIPTHALDFSHQIRGAIGY